MHGKVALSSATPDGELSRRLIISFENRSFAVGRSSTERSEMTAAVFENTDRSSDGRGIIAELLRQPTSVLTLCTVVAMLLVVGQVTSTFVLASVIAVLYAGGMVRLLADRRVSLWQTASIGLVHVGVAFLVAGTA